MMPEVGTCDGGHWGIRGHFRSSRGYERTAETALGGRGETADRRTNVSGRGRAGDSPPVNKVIGKGYPGSLISNSGSSSELNLWVIESRVGLLLSSNAKARFWIVATQ
jgi:hypothetical protein